MEDEEQFNMGVIRESRGDTIGQSSQQSIKIVKREKTFSVLKRNSQYGVTPARWLHLATFCIALTVNQIAWISLSPIASLIEKFYGQSPFVINYFPMIFQIVFLIFTMPSNYIIDNFGCHRGILLGSFLTTFGMIIKVFVNYRFALSLLGQLFPAIGACFLMNSITKLASIWFPQTERVIAITIIVATQALGTALGFLMPSFVISSDLQIDQTNPQFLNDQVIFKNQVEHLLFLQAVIAFISSIFCIFSCVEKPKKPPSPAALEIVNNSQNIDLLTQYKQLFKNKDFLILFLVFGQIQGSQNTLASILDYVLTSFQYNSDDTSYFGAVFIGGGVVGSILVGTFLQKTNKYKFVTIFICAASAIFSGLTCILIKFKMYVISMILCFFQGFSLISISAVSFDFGVELTYPLNENLSTGALNSSSQLFSVIYTLIATAIVSQSRDCQSCEDRKKSDSQLAFLFLIILCIIAALLSLFIKENLQRKKVEDQHEQNNKRMKIIDNQINYQTEGSTEIE